jgi:hypothetical protein
MSCKCDNSKQKKYEHWRYRKISSSEDKRMVPIHIISKHTLSPRDLHLVHDLCSSAINLPIYNVQIFQNNQLPSGPRMNIILANSLFFVFWNHMVSCFIISRVYQEERSVILRKNIYMNMCPIPNGFRYLERSILNLAHNIFLLSQP